MRAKTLRLACTVAVLAAMPLLTVAQESGWRMGVGASYRDFGDVDFESFTSPNYDNTDPAAGPLGLQGYTIGGLVAAGVVIPDFPTEVPFNADHASFVGGDGSVGSSDSWAPVITFEQVPNAEDGIAVTLVSNLQFYQVDVDTDNDPAALDIHNYQHKATRIGTVPTIAPNPSSGENAGPSTGTNVTVESDFEMDLFVIDVGLKASMDVCSGFSIYGAVGPTLNIADIETAQSLEATFFGPANLPGNPGNMRAEEDDDELDFAIGGYISLGGVIQIDERWAIGAEARYDALFGSDPGTSQAEIELDGLSGQLKVLFSF